MPKNSSSNRGKWVFLLVSLVVIGGVVWFFKSRKKDVVEYQLATVTRGDIVQVVTASGQLNPVVNVQVGSQISGRIGKLYANFNSVVKEGQLLAEIDPSTYKANVARAEADLASAKASLELAQLESRRASTLFSNNLLSASEYDTSVASLHQAEAAMQIREAALNSAKVDLSRCTIYSPVDGVVISRNVDVGQTVAASLSAPILFQIASDLTKMQIDANVAEADVGGIEVGQDVEFTVDAFPYRTFVGKVIQVRNAPLTVQNVVTYDTVIEVNNSDLKLKPGMTANVSIVINRREDVVGIPNAALRFRPPENAVPPVQTNSAAQLSRTNQPGQTNVAGAERRRRGDGPGGFGGPGGGFGGGRPRGRGERVVMQTVYLWPGGDPASPPRDLKLKPVKVKLGITDGVMTEALEGLNENDVLVIGSTAPSTAQSATGGQNPFGGGAPRPGTPFRRL